MFKYFIMEEITKMISTVISQTEGTINRALDNVYISTIIKVFIGLYAAFAAPKLPPSLVNLMDNVLVRIGFAFTIVLVATRDPQIALMVAIAFIITLQTANKFRLINTSLSVAAPGQSSWLPSAKDLVSEETPAENANVDLNEEALRPMEQQQELLPHHANNYPEDHAIMAASRPSENFSDVNAEPEGTSVCDNNNSVFTTQSQFTDAQSNEIPGADQGSCVQTFANQHCVQGLQENAPSGYNL